MHALANASSPPCLSSRYRRSKRLVGSHSASFLRCPSSVVTSTIRSNTSVCVHDWTTVSLALRPVHGFPMRPGWSLLHRLLRPICPICARCVPRSSPLAGKARWFLGSCLVTGKLRFPSRMGSGWLPNTFSLTESLRAEFFALAGAGTLLSFATLYPPTFARRGTALLASQTEYASPRLGHVSPSPITG
jgi:hypothetical protein